MGGHARIEGRRDEWDYNLLADYAWPLFAHGRAWPLLEEQMDVHMEKEEARIAGETTDAAEQKKRAGSLRRMLRESIHHGDSSPFLLGSVIGPVSVNPIGIYEGLFTYAFYPPKSVQCQWASFNVGEFLWAESRWSLLPLFVICGGCVVAMLLLARRAEAATGEGARKGAEPLLQKS